MAGDEFFPDDTAAPPADTSAFDGARGAGGRGRNDRRSGSGGGGGTRGRVPPHNMSAEESVLGALLLSRDAMNAVSELSLRPGDFYKPAHQRIFDAIRSLYSSGAPVDVVTVADELRRNGVLDEVGGAATLIADAVREVLAVHKKEEFGAPEAFWVIRVEDFPVVVTMDSHGRSIHQEVEAASQAALQRLVGAG